MNKIGLQKPKPKLQVKFRSLLPDDHTSKSKTYTECKPLKPNK